MRPQDEIPTHEPYRMHGALGFVGAAWVLVLLYILIDLHTSFPP